MRPHRDNIAAPELAGRQRWLNSERKPVMAELTAAGPVLVHFFDFAQLNSVRALPYAIEWDARYRDAGLTTLGVHSPRYPFTAVREALGPALERLSVGHPVADDSGYGIWHDYGCEGWPSTFLWGQGGALAWFHFGEGEYAATEGAIAEALAAVDKGFEAPEPIAPLRPSDAPGAGVTPPSQEVFPGGSASEPWRPAGGDEELELEYAAGGAHASVDGTGTLEVSLDGGPPQELAVVGPGLYDLAVHDAHEQRELRVAARGELAVYSLSFSAGVPA